MYGHGGLLIRRFDEVEDFARPFVEPVLLVIHTVRALHFKVARVRAAYGGVFIILSLL